jgi:IPT/TIG domain/Putative Ig domain
LSTVARQRVDHLRVPRSQRPARARLAIAVLVGALTCFAAVLAEPTGAFAASSSKPVVTGLSPDFGSTSGETDVTISGTGLAHAGSVKFGTAAAKIKSDSATSITAVSPAGGAGTVAVRVTTANGDSKASSSAQFTYVDSAPATVTITPQFTSQSCAGNIDTASWVPPSGVKNLTGFFVLEEQNTDEGPQFFDFNLGPDQDTLQFTVVNGETDILVSTVTPAGISSQPFGGSGVTGYGIPMPMQWDDQGDNSVADGSATVAFEWPGPPQSSETGGDVAADSVQITESPDGTAQNVPASLQGVSATFSDLSDGSQYTFTTTVSNMCGTSSESQASPVFVPGVLPSLGGTPTDAQIGVPYSYTLSVTGDPAPTLSVTSGSLPPGLGVSDDGTISGTPTATGDYVATITASNDVGIQPFSSGSASESVSITVDQPPRITSPQSALFTAGKQGSFTVTSTGFPAPQLSESGSLPDGLTFDVQPGGTATISGTPVKGQNGVYPITVTASNGVTPDAHQSLTVIVGPTITSPDFVTTIAGSPFSFGITAAGNGLRSIVCSGRLPAGLHFKYSGGSASISGTPDADSGGSYRLVLTATFATKSGSVRVTQDLTVVIDQPLEITSKQKDYVLVGKAFTQQITVVGYPGPTSITATGALPDGVVFSYRRGATATLSGKPDTGTEGVYSLRVVATDAVGGTAVQTLTLVVER